MAYWWVNQNQTFDEEIGGPSSITKCNT